MSLHVVRTTEEPLVGAAVERALREGLEGCGRATLLVPSFAQALDVQRSLAARGQAHALASELKKQDWQVRNHGRWARAFADGELERLLGACAEAERALKSGAEADEVMCALIARVCGAA